MGKDELSILFSKTTAGFVLPVGIFELAKEAENNFYEGIKEKEKLDALLMATKPLIEKDPEFSKISARILLNSLYQETFNGSIGDDQNKKKHADYFKSYIHHGIKIKRLDPKLLEFDLSVLSRELDITRDDKFQYLGLRTLYDRYFIRDKEKILETPQIFWMRVAMGLALREIEKERYAEKFYKVLSTLSYLSATPTLFNSGTCYPQLSSCYLSTTPDSLKGIFHTISNNAFLSKWAGGLGNDWTNIRATGALIEGTNGKSQGVIPFLKIANDTALAVNQGGKRKGATCAYLEPWHYDIEDFCELRKNTGDERRRTHDMHTALWIPDLFMKRILDEKEWSLFSPDETPDLHDLYGERFEKQYIKYEEKGKKGELRLFRTLPALQLWRKILSMLFETGHPWINFKDPANIRSPQDHTGVIHSSNLCTEILLNTSQDETAVCNLGSINLKEHMAGNKIDEEKLYETIEVAVRMLDNVIDINFYPTTCAKNANIRNRAIGLGVMGFQDVLHILDLPYASEKAITLADQLMEKVSYSAIEASAYLSRDRGPYSTYKRSKWERGLFPIDSVSLLEASRGRKIDMDKSSSLNWDALRETVRRFGMRNSNVLAIAPTATIANIAGVTQSFEPDYSALYSKSNLSGEFTSCNPYLVRKLKYLGLWDDQMIEDLKYFDGSIQEIERIPLHIKREFPTAFEIPYEWIIDNGSVRQKWLDQSQSLNLYLNQPSGKKLHAMYFYAWNKGLKTTYYLRTVSATRIEKSTLDINARKIQPRWMKSESPSSRMQVRGDACESDQCESCQ